ncbi:MAG: hypothetical protein Harvfovirus17_9 [Harvfovirus sp.]|uniref:Uncharacterized protein n=1 Tax=Harvfovirus sp. TaxID=2487768 RepID=A0A3G5A1N9_9VIRU|nr:MAG: hypothetical protein Harvfovirus17_9 [Harvfovirus sp.]
MLKFTKSSDKMGNKRSRPLPAKVYMTDAEVIYKAVTQGFTERARNILLDMSDEQKKNLADGFRALIETEEEKSNIVANCADYFEILILIGSMFENPKDRRFAMQQYEIGGKYNYLPSLCAMARNYKLDGDDVKSRDMYMKIVDLNSEYYDAKYKLVEEHYSFWKEKFNPEETLLEAAGANHQQSILYLARGYQYGKEDIQPDEKKAEKFSVQFLKLCRFWGGNVLPLCEIGYYFTIKNDLALAIIAYSLASSDATGNDKSEIQKEIARIRELINGLPIREKIKTEGEIEPLFKEILGR